MMKTKSRWSALSFLGAGSLLACELVTPDYTFVLPHTITCKMHRQECRGRARDGTCTGGRFARTTFTATACSYDSGLRGQGDRDECVKEYCTDPRDGTTYPDCAVETATFFLPDTQKGVCFPDSASTFKASVTYQQRYRTCVPNPNDPNDQCPTVSDPATFDPAGEGTMKTECVDASGVYGLRFVLPPSATQLAGVNPAQVRDDSVNIVAFVPNDSSHCGPTGAKSQPLTSLPDESTFQSVSYAVPPGNIGRASGAGAAVDLDVTQGFASINARCRSDGCDYHLESFAADLADVSVLGANLRGVSLRTTRPTPIGYVNGQFQVEPGDLKFALQGRLNGNRTVVNVENSTPWLVDFDDQGARLVGQVDVIGQLNGAFVPIKATIDTTVLATTPQQADCAAASNPARLFGFEEPANFTSPEATLSLVTNQLTQGCGALGVAGQGYLNITAEPFPTRSFGVKPAVSVDLFIPGNQPNPSYLGALQLYLSCPSATVNNQYVGQALLTGLPQNRFSTLRIPLPASLQQTLGRDLPDCSFKFGLNVNPTGRTWVLDNLRFTP